MNNRTVKAMRKQARGEVAAATRVLAQADGVNEQNGYATKRRVDDLERAVGHLESKARAVDAFRVQPFIGRLRWLLTGR